MTNNRKLCPANLICQCTKIKNWDGNCPMVKHGGKREGSGRKKKEETETTSFRINSEALNICRAAYGRTLNKHVNDFIKRLAKKAGKGSS